MQTKLKQIEALLQLVADEGIDTLDVADAQLSVHIQRQAHGTAAVAGIASVGENSPSCAATPQESADTLEVCAPVEGVFYRSASAGGLPLCEEGATVTPGAALGIIESMKIMNEIKASAAGTVKEVLPADGASVSQGQVLFIIDRG